MDLFTACTGSTSRMSHVNRFSSYPMLRRENVAEHSWWVSFIAMLIALDLTDVGESVRMAELLQRTICHDLNECMSGDIIRSYKYSDQKIRHAMEQADRGNMAELVENELGTAGLNVFLSWGNAKDDDLEGRIVSFADMATVAFFLREEYMMGNQHRAQVLMNDLYQKWMFKFADDDLLRKYLRSLFPSDNYGDIFREPPIPRVARPIMHDHSEGAVAAADFGRPDHIPLS